MPYIPRTSPHYEYARRIATGEDPARVAKDLGVKPNTAKTWRYRARLSIEKETGTRYPYGFVAVVATMPPEMQMMVLCALK